MERKKREERVRIRREKGGECAGESLPLVAKQRELARVRSVATVVTPCAASFVVPHHYHRRWTSVSHRRRELLSSHHKQDPMRRERQNDARRERRRSGVVSVTATFSAIAVCGVRRRRSHELRWGRRPSSLCCCSHRASTATLCFLIFLNY
ncbi:uncharacterized protein DS421_3g78020 [Arachis hypogaea]|nr:uncharacterized protein DS421_3g78020 [Arachis hypogaea]